MKWDDVFVGILGVIFIALIMFGYIALVTWVIMLLWNALVPTIFGLTAISFWQSMGLMFLLSLLFKSGGPVTPISGALKEKKKS